jgi:hypothetical protein
MKQKISLISTIIVSILLLVSLYYGFFIKPKEITYTYFIPTTYKEIKTSYITERETLTKTETSTIGLTTKFLITITTTITIKIKEDLIIINSKIGAGRIIIRDNILKEKILVIEFTPINLGNKKIIIESYLIKAVGPGLLNETPSMLHWETESSRFIENEVDLSPSSEYYNKVWCKMLWIEGKGLDPSKVVLGGNYTVFIPYKIDGEERVLNFTLTLEKIVYW